MASERFYVRKDGQYLKKEAGWNHAVGMLNHIEWVGNPVAATVFYLEANAKVWAKRVNGEVVRSEE